MNGKNIEPWNNQHIPTCACGNCSNPVTYKVYSYCYVRMGFVSTAVVIAPNLVKAKLLIEELLVANGNSRYVNFADLCEIPISTSAVHLQFNGAL